MRSKDNNLFDELPNLRIVWLTALTLVACTLPASAWSASDETDAPPDDKSSSEIPQSSQTDSEDQNESSFRLAPSHDVWDGTSARVSTVRLTICLATLPPGYPSDAQAIPTRWRTVFCVAPAAFAKHSQRQWLAGHYPHAPPVVA